MANTPATKTPDTGRLDFNDAPGGDLSWDTLFPEDGTPPVAATTPSTTAPAPATAAQPAVQQATEEFIRGEHTVYKTREAAVEGLNEKDRIIEQLRREVTQLKGSDPLSRAPQPQPTTIAPSTMTGLTNYMQNPEQYYKDLAAANAAGDYRRFAEIQAKFQADQLAPYGPLIAQSGREQAVQVVEKQHSDFRTFRASKAYERTLDEIPELKTAITNAENDPNLTGQLPALYRVAYLAAAGLNAPALVRAARETTPATQSTTTRPPMQPSTLPIPSTPAVKPGLDTPEGRKALIAELEAKGIKDVVI